MQRVRVHLNRCRVAVAGRPFPVLRPAIICVGAAHWEQEILQAAQTASYCKRTFGICQEIFTLHASTRFLNAIGREFLFFRFVIDSNNSSDTFDAGALNLEAMPAFAAIERTPDFTVIETGKKTAAIDC